MGTIQIIQREGDIAESGGLGKHQVLWTVQKTRTHIGGIRVDHVPAVRNVVIHYARKKNLPLDCKRDLNAS